MVVDCGTAYLFYQSGEIGGGYIQFVGIEANLSLTLFCLSSLRWKKVALLANCSSTRMHSASKSGLIWQMDAVSWGVMMRKSPGWGDKVCWSRSCIWQLPCSVSVSLVKSVRSLTIL